MKNKIIILSENMSNSTFERLYQMRRDTNNPALVRSVDVTMSSLYGTFGQNQISPAGQRLLRCINEFAIDCGYEYYGEIHNFTDLVRRLYTIDEYNRCIAFLLHMPYRLPHEVIFNIFHWVSLRNKRHYNAFSSYEKYGRALEDIWHTGGSFRTWKSVWHYLDESLKRQLFRRTYYYKLQDTNPNLRFNLILSTPRYYPEISNKVFIRTLQQLYQNRALSHLDLFLQNYKWFLAFVEYLFQRRSDASNGFILHKISQQCAINNFNKFILFK